ncbi:UPF0060 membrane protein [Devosia pacifica]|uniref:UPF0060 membrane protein n=1 Tax=Devosia pacifica TaxID=1335967 RepID=A0A918SGJ1_9HYPH|nr:YnfA family protein [Devosia pacifica]GHA38079.1 UPF0060 membrane protein [Devosia pacifica]
MRFLLFFAAAGLEIGGCYLVWLALRQQLYWLLLPAAAALLAFGLALALAGTESAGRAFAAYGGIYIGASIAFMAGVERIRPETSDLVGAGLCLVGAAIIYFSPRIA